MCKKHLLILLLPVLWAGCSPMPNLEYINQRQQFTLDEGDTIIRCSYLHNTPKIKVQNDKYYSWYMHRKLHRSQGGFEGKVLDGDYIVYDSLYNIHIHGQYTHGLKDETWKYWEDGLHLSKILTYDEGELDGPYELYNGEGKVIESGKYKNGSKEGKVIKYDETGKEMVLRYKHGDLQEVKSHKPEKAEE